MVQTDVQLRWIISRDLEEVAEIEARSFREPWSEPEFRECLKLRNHIGIVAEIDFRIVGYMLYSLEKSVIRIVNFAVDPDERRSGIGRQMVQRLIDKMATQRRTSIEVSVPESCLSAQLLLQSCGFRAAEIVVISFGSNPTRGHGEHTSYLMRYERPL